MFLIVLPIVVLAPTAFNLNGFDFELCGASGYENIYYLSYYTLVGILSIFWILGILIKHYGKNSISKKQIILVGAGIEFFLLSFLVTSFLASYFNDVGLIEDYSLEFYGIFGMIVFLGILGYSIVKFRLFNIKVIGANAMVFALWVLIGSLLFIEDILVLRIIISITLMAAIILGYLLINAVRNEVDQRVHIEKLAGDLKKANTRLLELDKQKSEFVSFATHQLRAPLTAMKGYTSLILEGEMGDTTSQVREAVGRIYDSSKTLTNIVDDYLNISRIELGTMKYSFEMLNLKDLVENVIGELKPNIDRSGLAFAFSQVPADPKERFMVHADTDKLKQVVANLIDNSVKYTPKGSLEVGLLKSTPDRKIVFSVKDTGVGIAPEVMPKLFQKFIRAENANKQNIYGTGLGLFVAKEIVAAHKGRIWAESDGEGKGSTFYLELEMAV